MKPARLPLVAMLLALSLTALGSPAAKRAARPAASPTPQYVRLDTWAGAHAAEVRWLRPEQSVQLATASGKLVLAADSREAIVNGIEVWLSFPAVYRAGNMYLGRSDAENTLGPLMRPPASPRGRLKTICLDPGHGGKDPGYCFGSYQEKKYTLLFAEELRDQLGRAGFKVSLTRTRDKFLDLDERPDLARRRRADLFISLHFNAAETSRSSVQGAQVFCLTPAGAESTNSRGEGGNKAACTGNRNNEQNLLLAYDLQRALTRGVGVEDRGVRRARFAVLREAVMPAVLVEAGFMSHPVEGRKIFSAAYRRELAQALTAGVLAYKRTVER